MGKRKIFTKSDLSIPRVEYVKDAAGAVVILPEAIPPVNTKVEFKRNPTNKNSFDFIDWYGFSIDQITYACQRQVERFIAGQDGDVEDSTVVSYCVALRRFLNYCMIRAAAFRRHLVLADVNRDLIDGYIGYLETLGVELTSQKGFYSKTKSVLLALGKRGLIPLVTSGDEATFPFNPYPNINRKYKGEKALTKREKKEFTIALRHAVKAIWDDDVFVSGEVLAFAILVVALHTGRNTTPLLEMDRDCLRSHPKRNTTFLVLWKRRGHNTSKVVLRSASEAERLIESTPSLRVNVEQLIRRVMVLTEPLRDEVSEELKNRVWLCRDRVTGRVTVLSTNMLLNATRRLIDSYGLRDANGDPLNVNVSRLRKTFANRIFELTDGDLVATAAALGNTTQATEQSYLAPGEEALRNWQFMGEILVQELLTKTIGATFRQTPMGRCADPEYGQYAPKREGATCMNFMSCLRCKHYVVTADDLYKVYSFYFRVLAERSRMDKRRWSREYSHIPRLIDNYIVAEGLRRGTFKVPAVEAARERAREQPHPFWSLDSISSLDEFS